MSAGARTDLPKTWIVTSIGAVSTVNPPGSTVVVPDNQSVTFLPMAAVEELSGRIVHAQLRPFGEVKKGFTRFRDGDVLFAKITPCMENGKVAVARGLAQGVGCGSTEFHVVRPVSDVDADYIRYFIVRSAFREEARRNMQGAVGQQRVPADFIRNTALPLPPPKEQRRIVSKINELFSRIDEGERVLEIVQELVEHYRQSIIKAAVTGELTRGLRIRHEDKLESGAALFERAIKARRQAWEEAELEKMKLKGVVSADDKWMEKYQEPTEPKIALQEDLPTSWTQLSIEQITRGDRPVAYGVLQPGKDIPSGIPLVRVCDVADGVVDVQNIKKISQPVAAAFPRTKLRGGEVLLTVVGTIGRTAVVPMALAGANVARAVAVMVPTTCIASEWLELFLRYQKTRQNLTKTAREVARKTLNLEQLREYAVQVPPLAEQEEIVSRAKELLSRADAVERDIRNQKARSEALRQAILKAAFSGVLVRQDLNDESATSILGRASVDGKVTSGAKHSHKTKAKRAA